MLSTNSSLLTRGPRHCCIEITCNDHSVINGNSNEMLLYHYQSSSSVGHQPDLRIAVVSEHKEALLDIQILPWDFLFSVLIKGTM